MTDFAERLIAARRTGALVSGPIPPLSIDAGYACAANLWRALGTPAGWKIGATNARGQAFLGIDTPIRGRIFSAGLFASGAVAVPGDRLCEVEPEILIRIGAGDSIAAVHIGLEIVRSSSATPFDHGVGFILADNAAHVALVIGPPIDPALLATPDEIAVTFGPHRGTAAAVLGDPRAALDWLAAVERLAQGDWVATGAMTPAQPLTGEVVGDFGTLGCVYAKVMAANAE